MNKKLIISLYLKYRLYIFPVVISLAIILLISLVIYPQTTKLIENNNEYRVLNQKISDLENKAIELNDLSESELKENINLVLASFPPDKDYPTAFGVAQTIVTQSGFTIEGITLGGLVGAEGDSTQGYNLNLEVTGERAGISKLLTNIVSSPRLMKLSNIEVNTNPNSDLSSVSLVLRVYYSPVSTTVDSTNTLVNDLTEEDQKLLTNLSNSAKSLGTSEAVNVNLPRGKEDIFQ